MFSICTTLLLLAATAASQEAKEVDRPWFGVGPTTDNLMASDDQTLKLLEQARNQPNLTQTLYFNPFIRLAVPELSPELRNVDWSWRK